MGSGGVLPALTMALPLAGRATGDIDGGVAGRLDRRDECAKNLFPRAADDGFHLGEFGREDGVAEGVGGDPRKVHTKCSHAPHTLMRLSRVEQRRQEQLDRVA